MLKPVPCRHYSASTGCTHPHPAIVRSLIGATYCVVAHYYQGQAVDPRLLPPACALMDYQTPRD